MFVLLTTVLLISNLTQSAKILGLFVIPSISHSEVYQPIWRELSLRGHDVTVMSPSVLGNEKLTNLTEIDVGIAYSLYSKWNMTLGLSKDRLLIYKFWFVMSMLKDMTEVEINHEDIQKLINNTDAKFDVIILECFHPLIYGFGAKFKAPIIGVSSLGAFLHNHDAMGNPTHPILAPDLFAIEQEDPTLFDRLNNVVYSFLYRILYYWYLLPESDRLARKYFGSDMPYLGDIERNMSLLLVNVNPILHSVRPNVPAVVEIGQMHLKEKKPLPQDLQEFLDSAKEGVVYFSLGSNVKSMHLGENIRNAIIEAFSELPYKVLWKWEADFLPGLPKNVITRKWLPQQDVLAHPNIKVFITQGGIQSIEEAIFNEVPMVGIPFIGDQPLNVKKIAQMGMGLRIDFNYLTKDKLKNSILEVAQNKKYKEHVREAKALINDQPLTGVDKAIWWIEYVIRNKGARHLRSPAVDMPWYQYFMLDVFALVLVIIVLFVYLVAKVCSLVKFSSTKHKRKEGGSVTLNKKKNGKKLD